MLKITFYKISLPMYVGFLETLHNSFTLSGVDGLGHKKILYVSRYLLHIIKRKNRAMDLFTSQDN